MAKAHCPHNMQAESPPPEEIQEGRSRVIIQCRMHPDAIAAHLPSRMRPLVLRGSGLCFLTYRRMRVSPGLLHGPSGETVDHLSFRVAVEFGSSVSTKTGAWVMRRESSSWLESRCGGALQRGVYRQAEFHLKDEPHRMCLHAEADDALTLEFDLEACDGLKGSVFASTREAMRHLVATAGVRPRNRLVPSADRLGIENGRVEAEPMKVLSLRSAFLDDPVLFPPGSVELDSAFRLVPVRTALVPKAVEAPGSQVQPAH